jgi:RHS repeat-associated protein
VAAIAGTLGYDGLNRLTAEERHLVATGTSISNEAFTLDPASNIASRTGPAASFSYDGANRLRSDGTRPFAWDGADRLTVRGSDHFSYDPLSRMTAATVAGVSRTYGYDGDGLLRSRTQGPTTTTFTYDASVAPAPLLQSGTERLVYGLGPLYQVHPTGTYDTLVRDGLGSIRLTVSGTGAVTGGFDYTAYGAPSVGSFGTSLLGFAGELQDPSGLIYLRARWYDPSIGRFASSDPVSGTQGTPETLNRYTYAGTNPVGHTDPTGLCHDPGGTGVRYCIERLIPTAIACHILCGTGDNRGPSANTGTFKVRPFVLADGTVTATAGDSGIGPDGLLPRTGELTACAGVSSGGGIETACGAYNGYRGWPDAPNDPIYTRLRIVESAGRVTVSAFGTYYPSLEVWRYGGGGPQLVFYYNGEAVGLSGLSSRGTLANLVAGK